MKVAVEADFLCSYYWHAALAAEGAIKAHQLPDSLYYSITSILLAQCGKSFAKRADPFVGFAELVDLRNALVHLDSEKLRFEKNAPTEARTVGDLRAWINSDSFSFWEGTPFADILIYGLAGTTIVRGMIEKVHQMIAAPTPDFLNQEIVFKVRIGQAAPRLLH